MADIFIAYTKDDCFFVNDLSKKIEANNLTTWYYGRNKSLFRDPLSTSRIEIEKCGAFLMVISDLITQNNFIDSELKWAKINHKPIVVILSNLTEKELARKFPDWAYILYTTTTCTQIPMAEPTDRFIEKLIENLKSSKGGIINPPTPPQGKLKIFYEYLITRNDRFYYLLLLVLFTLSFVYFVTVIAK